MIHFFPELAALYHRSLIISLEESGKTKMWDEWIHELWNFSPNKTNFYTHAPSDTGSPLAAFYRTTLGKRNKDEQKIMGFCSSLEVIEHKPETIDYADSLLIEVDPASEATEALFRWQPGPAFSSKRVVWCMRSPFNMDASLHEQALDKKLAELSPDSLRIFWPKGQFIRDALEWVLSF